MVSAEEFNHQKKQLAKRYEAAGGNPHDLDRFQQGADWNAQIQVMRTKVEEQEAKSQRS